MNVNDYFTSSRQILPLSHGYILLLVENETSVKLITYNLSNDSHDLDVNV